MNSPQPSDAVRSLGFPTQEVEMTSPLRKMRAALALGASLAVLCACALAAAAQTTGTIRGKVTDATTGRPVDGAQLYVAGTDLGTLSNADGQYQFSVRAGTRSEEHTSELQSPYDLVCRLLLEKKKKHKNEKK